MNHGNEVPGEGGRCGLSRELRFALWLALILSSRFALAQPSAPGTGNISGVPQFVDITEKAGLNVMNINGARDSKEYIFEAKGGGLGCLDYDNDGWLDLLFVQGSTLERYAARLDSSAVLYRNRGNGTFEDVSQKAGLDSKGWGMGVAVGDYDNDGWVDFYLTRLGSNVLYRNRRDGKFEDVTEKAGVGDPRWSTSAAFVDIDRDGDLDLYVANYLDVGPEKLPGRGEGCTYAGRVVLCGPRGLPGAADALYRNNGDGTFTDVSETSGTADRNREFGLGVVAGDVDNDGDQDIFVGNDSTPNQLFVNRGDGTFEEMGLLSGLAVNGEGGLQASMGVDLADYDNDGWLDAYATHFANDYNTLYRNLGNLVFKDVTAELHLQSAAWLLVSWGTRFADFNLDGWKDLLHVCGHVYPFLKTAGLRESYEQGGKLYINKNGAEFVDVTEQTGKGLQEAIVGRGAAFGDFDNDGDLDVLVANLNGRPLLLRNDRTDFNHWVMFRTVGNKSNRDGIGTRLIVTTGSLEQVWEVKRTVGIYSSSDPRAHFGLGSAQRIDRLKVTWPSGESQEFEDLPVDRHYVIREGEEIAPDAVR